MKCGTKIYPGDWVRFLRDGSLVVGVVQYVHSAASWESCMFRVITDAGRTDEVAILELRGASVPIGEVQP